MDPTRVLKNINDVRARYGAPPVVWSYRMATVAQSWADRRRFEHRPCNEFGENIAIATMLEPGMDSAIRMFAAESRRYDWDQPGYSPSTGHFTALVWKGTRRVGAGVAAMPDGLFMYVLNFDPPGNVVNADMRLFRDNVGRLRA
jgi:hypothetical protein